ncbi:MAG: hypothetical protein ABI970_07785 [Chloroflexota bacterium]
MLKNTLIRRSIIIITMMMILQACQAATETLPPTPTAPPTTDSVASVTPTVAALPAGFNPSGKLILSDYNSGVSEFDFSTMTLVSKFSPPNNGFVGSTVLSPDSKTFLMIYSIPRDIGDPQYGAADLYTLSADGSGEPKLLLNTTESGDYYFSPWWAPDGQSVYYGRLYTPLSGTPTKPTGYFLVHYALPGGPPQDLTTNILGVRVSADGKKLFYVSVDPQTTLSNIYEANLDGANAKSLLPEKETWIIDSIGVSPDGQSVIFNRGMPATSQSGFSLLDELMGVRVASAHNLPSDIWIAKSDETPKQLSHLNGYGFVADFSPDGQYIAFSCDTGVYVIRADGTEQTKISNVPDFSMLQWAS